MTLGHKWKIDSRLRTLGSKWKNKWLWLPMKIMVALNTYKNDGFECL